MGNGAREPLDIICSRVHSRNVNEKERKRGRNRKKSYIGALIRFQLSEKSRKKNDNLVTNETIAFLSLSVSVSHRGHFDVHIHSTNLYSGHLTPFSTIYLVVTLAATQCVVAANWRALFSHYSFVRFP